MQTALTIEQGAYVAQAVCDALQLANALTSIQPLGKLTSFYALLFNGCSSDTGAQYAYVGKAVLPTKRYLRHKRECGNANIDSFKARVWRKYGEPVLHVFDFQYDFAYSAIVEQECMNAMHRLGFALCNASKANLRLADSTLDGEALMRQHLRDAFNSDIGKSRKAAASARRWQDDNYKTELSTKLRLASSTPEHKEKMSAISKAAWQNADYRNTVITKIKRRKNDPVYRQQASEHMRARLADPAIKEKSRRSNKLAWQNPTTIQAHYDAMHNLSAFATAYHAKRVYAYKLPIDKFEPWMSFIIQPDNNVIVFVWDTRKVLFQCKKEDLPDGYRRVKDSHKLLLFN